MVLEQVLPQGDLGGELGRAEVAADGVLGVRVHKADVVLQARDVGVVLSAVRALALPRSGRRRPRHGGHGDGGRGRGQTRVGRGGARGRRRGGRALGGRRQRGVGRGRRVAGRRAPR